MKVGIIGYGSMGKMLVDQFAASGKLKNQFLLVSNRTKEKLKTLPAGANACNNNRELACLADIVFLCVKPGDLKEIIEEIRPDLKHESILVSLNGSVPFALMEKISAGKIAKVIPSLTAEINRSQTLVCYNQYIEEEDKAQLKELLEWAIYENNSDQCIGQIAFCKIWDDVKTAEIEYCIGSDYQGNGYAGEALSAIIDYAFSQTDFKRLEAYHRAENPRSGKVLVKSLMHQTDTVERFRRVATTEHKNEVCYAMTADEWMVKER